MKFTAVLFFLAACSAEHHHRREGTDYGINLASISSALEHMTANQTASANFANISSPPKSLIPEILSVVPVSVIWELVNPAQRSSLASQFKAGSTPAWYSNLPTDVKSYMSVVKSQISGGALTATTGLAYETPTATATGSESGSTDGASGSATASGMASTSTGGAAQATGLTVSVMGAMGVLGLALAL
ncbi:hypothetical protein PENANT_c002G01335 [Penicillium antarcticum]|uniref:FAS1 domain-containing protein n=1 Tax=Penicillium antarcticum TaxID=416450 RepID=A0A1V6QKZ5_9EURO|nr:uncharacterized protein N7508_008436 [Penicillium antarcticum]KAJ5293615.1 hypothetical protein N7508_008436 [Penicillium antarcticum]OQD89642.1 hypothetical protein PENANT_c002G01335 [Penicillium antarcticum]